MKLFFEYEAQHPDDKTEYWTIIREDKESETEKDIISPINKVEASYCAKYFPSDLPIITFFPASRGRPMADIYYQYKDEYFIFISNRENTIEIVSKISYKWGDAQALISKYRSVLFPKLLKLLEKDFYIREIR